MSKDQVVLKGELKWAVVPPNSVPQKVMNPKPGQENNSHWSIEVECDRDLYDELLDKGMSPMTKLRKDDETGKRFIKLRAPKVNGTYIANDPDIVDASGKAINVAIANGSQGEVHAQFERFKSKSGIDVTSVRFKKVVVTKLIPFVKGNPNEQAEAHAQDLNPPADTVNTATTDW